MRLAIAELLKRGICGLPFCANGIVHAFEQEEVLAIEGVDHLSPIFIVISLGINILNDLTRVLMKNELSNLLVYLGSEIFLLLLLWRVIESLLSKMIGIFLAH